jgi:hypothetical protein
MIDEKRSERGKQKKKKKKNAVSLRFFVVRNPKILQKFVLYFEVCIS